MKKNVGTVDMVIRLILSIGLFYIGFFDNPIVSAGTSQTIIKYIAFIPFLTGLLRFCPLYVLIGVATCKNQSS
jgi:hypothetical protein